MMRFSRPELEALYKQYNHRHFVSPDPLEVLYSYDDAIDRDVVGLFASGLAYGRVNGILASLRQILPLLGSSPAQFVLLTPPSRIKKLFGGFRHRFTTGQELCVFIEGIRRVLEMYGSVEACMTSSSNETSWLGRAEALADILLSQSPNGMNSLLPHPSRGSACKRLHLYFRWMVRCDAVDPGGWHSFQPASLIVPLDTHLHRIALSRGLTNRKSADGVTAREVTEAFAVFCPEDPVRYDFALTREGIHRNNLQRSE